MAITPDAVRFCPGCMAAGGNDSVCGICGWDDRVPESQSHLPRHYVLLDRYYVGRTLGRGGFGVTYLAWDLKLNRAAAIKEYMPSEQCSRLIDRATIRPHGGETADNYAYGMNSFPEEARLLVQFGNHPCIVWITDFAETNGTAYLVMAYESGGSLKDLARCGGRIPFKQALRVLMRVMDVKREVHSRGVLHRDIARTVSC